MDNSENSPDGQSRGTPPSPDNPGQPGRHRRDEQPGRQSPTDQAPPQVPEEKSSASILEADRHRPDLLLFAAAKSRRRQWASAQRWCSPTRAAATSSRCSPAALSAIAVDATLRAADPPPEARRRPRNPHRTGDRLRRGESARQASCSARPASLGEFPLVDASGFECPQPHAERHRGRDPPAHRGLRKNRGTKSALDPLPRRAGPTGCCSPPRARSPRPSPPRQMPCWRAAHPWPHGLTQAAGFGRQCLAQAVTWAKWWWLAINRSCRVGNVRPRAIPGPSAPGRFEEPVDLKERGDPGGRRYGPWGSSCGDRHRAQVQSASGHGQDPAEAAGRQVVAAAKASDQAHRRHRPRPPQWHLKAGRAEAGPGR